MLRPVIVVSAFCISARRAGVSQTSIDLFDPGGKTAIQWSEDLHSTRITRATKSANIPSIEAEAFFQTSRASGASIDSDSTVTFGDSLFPANGLSVCMEIVTGFVGGLVMRDALASLIVGPGVGEALAAVEFMNWAFFFLGPEHRG